MLFTYTSGEPASPGLVFLHGGGLSGRIWQPQMERLPDYYCLAPDLPEQGKSLTTPFQLEDAARQVIALIEERLPDRRVHLVGLSLGAAVALAIMRIAPQYVDHAIVTGTAPFGKLLGSFSLAMVPLARFMNLEKQIEASYQQFGIPEAYRPMFREDTLISTNPAFLRHMIEALMDLSRLLPCTALTPTLVAVGEKEVSMAKQGAKKFAACLKHSQRVVAPGLGHVWNLQAPDLFTDTVRAWIEDRPLPESLLRL